MPGFERVNPIGEGLIRGPARLIIAPSTIAFPSNLSQMLNLAPTSVSYAPAVQTISTSGTPTGGTFVLAFNAVETAPIAYNASAAAVAAALNALSSISSVGGVTATGGPLPTAVVLTFGVNGSEPAIAVPPTGMLLTGGTTPSVGVAITTLGNGQFDVAPGTGWVELGSTRGGVKVTMNNTEDQLDIDQIYGSILGVPNEWESTVATQLAETTLANIQVAWDQGAVYLDATQTPNESHLPVGNPLSYTQRKLAVVHQKTIGPAAGLVRAHIFRLVTRSPQDSGVDYQKAGQMQTIPITFRVYADATVSNPYERMGEIIEQSLVA